MLDVLRDSWLAYLLKDCHRVAGGRGATALIRSRNGKNRRYRWLLWVSEGPTRTFSRSARAGIRLHLSQARRLRETLYFVVWFLPEPRRIVVLRLPQLGGVGFERQSRTAAAVKLIVEFLTVPDAPPVNCRGQFGKHLIDRVDQSLRRSADSVQRLLLRVVVRPAFGHVVLLRLGGMVNTLSVCGGGKHGWTHVPPAV